MIELLKEIELKLPELLKDPSVWKTVDVNYHPPRVERLWTQLGENRLMLHVIHPCKFEEALYHPHPWPSAMHILEGRYETGLGFKDTSNYIMDDPIKPYYFKIKQIAKLELTGDNYYEMLDPKGWHYVRPIDDVCYSIMLIGKPWESNQGKGLPDPGKLLELSEERKLEIIQVFKDLTWYFDLKEENEGCE